MAIFVFWCYALKFLPSALSILVLYGLTLRSFCEQIAAATNATACWTVYPVNVGSYNETHNLALRSFHGWGDHFYDGFYLAQHITLALITLHLSESNTLRLKLKKVYIKLIYFLPRPFYKSIHCILL